MRNSLFFTLLIFILCSFSSFAQDATIGTNVDDCVTMDLDGVWDLMIPSGVNLTIEVEAWGAGGGSQTAINHRSGGGGGAYYIDTYDITGCSTFQITVGKGAINMNGGDTSYDFGTGNIDVKGGELDVIIAGIGYGGAGGNGPAGCTPGGKGGDRAITMGTPDGGGGGGGGSGPGNTDGQPGILNTGGLGGMAGTPGGAGGDGGNIGFLGMNGSSPGGGAGGKGTTFTGMVEPGAAGGHGQVIICVEASTPVPPPNAGMDGAITICAGESVSLADLEAAITGEDTGGSWDMTSGGGGTYSYTVTSDAYCTDDQSIVTVTEETPPNAGTGGNLTICQGDALTYADLFGVLTGADITGNWDNPPSGAGTYTYTVTGVECMPSTAIVEVIEEIPPNAGTDGNLVICQGDVLTAADLFAQLTGADTGGTWSPTPSGAGTYTYTVTGTVCMPASTSMVEVTEETPPNAGTGMPLVICQGDVVTDADLFAQLTGADTGGTWSPTPSGAGTYTYTVTGTVCMPASTSMVEVTEETPPNAGTGMPLVICQGDVVTAADLFAQLTGADTGGTWSPTPSGAGTYTYTVTGTACMPASTSMVEVTEETPPNAGTGMPLVICQGDVVTAADLFAQLTGADTGGTWSPTPSGAGTYTYTVTGTVCMPASTSMVEVTEETPPNAGTGMPLVICQGDVVTAADLFAQLTGADTGGTWSPTPSGAGTYTYTVTGTVCMPASTSMVEVTEETPPNAGTGMPLVICQGDVVTAADLFAQLTGADTGGTWSPTPSGAGTYTYTVTGTVCMPASTSMVEVTEETPPNAGTGMPLVICQGDVVTAADLFAQLTGADTGGTWSPTPSGAGTYTYTVTGTVCMPASTSMVEVTEETPPNAGTGMPLVICQGDVVTAADLFAQLTGADTGGTWSPTPSGAGTYTYTVTGTVCMPASTSMVEVTEETPPNAGTGMPLVICQGDVVTDADLFAQLTGADTGGTWSPTPSGAGTYTYTVTGTVCMPASTSMVEVTEETPPNAGTGMPLVICQGDVVTAADLFAQLTGADTGGTWSPTPSGAGTYTYTVTGTACMPASTSMVEVTEETPPNAGTGMPLVICQGDVITDADLFAQLTGADTGGTWSPTPSGAGTYTYTVTGTVCMPASTSMVEVTEETPPNAGTGMPLVICQGDVVTAADLFAQLTGADTGGTWSPTPSGAGTYTYTVTGTVCMPASTSMVEVTEETPPNAGTGMPLVICQGDVVTAADLFAQLTGADTGGTWSPTPSGAGTYTYTVTGTACMPASTSMVEVTEETPPNAGTGMPLVICQGDVVTAADLFAQLTGADTGGTWSPTPSGAGTYTYTVTGTVCMPASTSMVEVTEETPPNAGTGMPLVICQGDVVTAADLFAQLTGADTGGTWSPTPSGAGTYTYTVTGTVCMPASTSMVEVTEETPPNAGTGMPLVICQGDVVTAADLFAQLTGADTGGTWSPTPSGAGTYTYTVTGTVCMPASTSMVEVTEETPPNAGTGMPLVICQGDVVTAADLFAQLTGADTGGTWSPTPSGAGTYTYTVTGTVCMPASTSMVEVTEETPPNAGTGMPLVICQGDVITDADLFAQLTGADTGGTWSPTPSGAGTYTYTVTGTVCMPASTSMVEVTEETPPNAGTGMPLVICQGDVVTAADLFAQLTGADTGGTWSPTPSGAGTYTYTVTGTVCMPASTSMVEVTEETPPNAGTGMPLVICQGDVVTAADLFAQLTGADTGGTWSPTPSGAGTYTYTVTGTVCMPASTSMVEVTEETPPNAGTGMPLLICQGDVVTAADLFAQLTGADTGGTWSPTPSGAGTYTYTFTGTVCMPASTSMVEVTEETPPNAGTGMPLVICQGDVVTAADLFAQLTGADTGGTWSPTPSGAGTYTYTVTGTVCMPASTSMVEVTEETPPNAGTGMPLVICQGDVVTAADLFAQLTGADTGGTWSPTPSGAGTYTYTVTGTVCMPASTSMVEVTEETPPNAGTGMPLVICQGDVITDADLFAQLTGADTGGTWSPTPSGAGTYTYTVTGTVCMPASTSMVEVTEETPPNAGMNGSLTVCEGTFPTDAELFTALMGSPDAGGMWSNVGLTYTYTVLGNTPCANATAEVQVTETPPIIPTFTQLGTYCENEIPDILPLISLNGIMGTWDGPIITTTAGTITYNFTPDPGECATPTTMDIEVEVCDCDDPPSVTVDMISPICENETLDLSAVIGGGATMVTWTTSGDGMFDDDMSLTPIYTPGTADIANGTVTLMVITDDPDGTDPCEADDATIILTINSLVTPMFTQLGPYCIDEIPDDLPLTSMNGIIGTWDGPIVTTTAGIITYNFTPDIGECATPTTMDIEVEVCDCANPPTVMIDPIMPICENETIDLTAVIGGDATMVTWTTTGDGMFDDDMSLTPVYTPGVADITNGTVTLMVVTDDPDGTDPCEADDATIILTINALVTPMFTQLGTYCENETPDVLPLTSVNGIMGTWDGPIVTTTAGIITYNFTPDTGECATPTTMDIEVEVCDCDNPPTVMIDAIMPICENETIDLTAVIGGDATMVTWTTTGDGMFDDDMSLTPVYTPGAADIVNGTVTLMVVTDDPDGTDPCEADDATIILTINALVTPMFMQLGIYCIDEIPDVLPLTSVNGIMGTWDGPIVTTTAGTITYNFTPDTGECATPTTMDIEVEVCDCDNPPTVMIDPIMPICENETIDLTAVIGGDATMVTWTTTGDGMFDDDMSLTPVYTPGAADITNGTVTLMVVTDDPDGTDPCEADDATIVLTINALVTPMFTQLGTYCENETPDVLPLTSVNGIMGTWDGPIVTTTAGIITYNFTPDTGECATPTTMDIEVEVCDCDNPPTVMIDAIMPICENETIDLTAVIGGDATMVTWTTTGDGMFDDDMSLTPVYTPGAADIVNGTVTLMVVTDDPDGTDPCEADDATIILTINALVTPMFMQLGIYCIDEIPDVLPLTSVNGIMGTWDGPIVTTTAGIITYNFTPDTGECATPTTMDIEVEVCDCDNPPTVMIDAIMPICENETIDLTAVIGGDATMVTWTTTGDGMFDDDMSLTPVYTPGAADIVNGTVTLMVVTDDPDGTDPCEADDATIILTINALVTPMFMQLGIYCIDEIPDVLPLTSVNGIMGTWDGPIVTTTAGIITYNFTPDAGECATPTTMDIEVEVCDCANPPSVTVDMISPICENETLGLSAVLGGDATMVTWTTSGDGMFDDDMSLTPVYTPGVTDITNGTVTLMVVTDDPDGTDPCEADDATIVLTINARVTPMFMQLGTYCIDEVPDVLPLTSVNGIMGTWDGPIVTTTAGTITYNFTPDAGECATPTTMDIEVEVCDCANPPSVTVDMISPICENETLGLSAVLGGDATMVTWTTSGDGMFDDDMSLTPVYTPGVTDITNGTVTLMVVTDDPDGTDPCEADDATIVLTINARVTPMFMQLGTYCIDEVPDVLPLISLNGIMGTWDGPIITTTAGTITYNFTPDPGECATPTTMDIEVEVCDCANPPSVTVDMISPICENETLDLSAVIGGGATMVTWTTSGDGMFDDDMSLTPVYTPGTADIANGTVTLMVVTDDPDGTDPCEADDATIVLTINARVTPMFMQLGTYCIDEVPDVLPLISLNGIMGTWDGPIVTTTAGIITYNFTPDTGECATPTTMDIEVEVCDCDNPPTVMIDAIMPICENETIDLTAVIGGDATMVTWTTTGDGMFDNDMSLTPVYTPGAADIVNGTVTLMVVTDDPDGTDPCEADDATIILTINALVTPMFMQLGIYCIDEIPDVLPLTSVNGIMGTWDGPIVTTTAGIITYNFTPDAGECATPTTMDIEVEVCDCANPPTVTVDMISPICENETLGLSAVLGGDATMVTWTTSGDGMFDDDMSLTPVYTPGAADITNGTVTLMVVTDDPDGTDPCEADDATIVLTINALVTPMFTQLGTYCENEIPDVLPLTSVNGIMGTWDGPIVTTTAGIITYNFTPDAGECATPTTMDIEVEVCDCANPPSVTVDMISPICENETLGLSAVLGGDATMVTWTTSGDGMFDDDMSLTPVYTPGVTDITNGTVTLMVVTDDPDGTDPCEADDATIVLTINARVTPMFMQLGTYCIDEVPDVLPLTSVNGIMGTWDGPIVTTTAGTITYNFTPDAGECATPTTMDIEVEVCDCANPPSVTVDMISPICENQTLELNAVIGGDATMVTWTTSGDGTFDDDMSLTPVYTPGVTDITNGTVTLMVVTDDPDGTDPCEADDATIILTINALVTPMFMQLGTYCIDEVPDVLPLTSMNGIMGTWDGPIVTTTAGTITYNFTPDAGECATPTTMNIEVEVCDCANPPSVTVDMISPICENETIDLSAVLGGDATMVTWTTAGDGTFDDDMSLTPVYTPGATDITNGSVTLMVVTDDPDGTDPCEADDATLVLTINTLVTPMFTQLGTYCENEVPDVLPLTSLNGIMGTWDGPIVTTTAGIITYNFTPDAGECATTTTMDITVSDCACVDPAMVSIDLIQAICEDETLDLNAILSGSATMLIWTSSGDGAFDDVNSLTAVYNPGVNDVINGTVTLTVTTDDPDGMGPCDAAFDNIDLTINSFTVPTFDQLGPYCIGDLPDVFLTNSQNGITGSWNGPIATTAAGMLTYDFTPDSGQCASATAMEITVTDCGCVDPALVSIDGVQAICEDGTLDLNAILSGSATMLIWTSSGDGAFDDVNSLTAVYNPGVNDVINGTVTLTATTDDPDGMGPCDFAFDNIDLTISPLLTFVELEKNCQINLASYSVTVQTDATEVAASNGDVTNNTDGTFTIANIPKDEILTIVLTLNDCVTTKEITPPNCNVDLIMPNIFSPNNDGNNEVFYVMRDDVEVVTSMKVYDRWGELIFSSENQPANDPSYGWNGKFKGKPINPGVFVYVVQVLYFNGTTETTRGNITVVR